MLSRRGLLLAAASALLARPSHASRVAGSDNDTQGARIPLPHEGVKIEWGYQIGNNLLIMLEHSGRFRNPFDANRLYYFPNQDVSTAQVGFQQSSTGEASTSSITEKEKRIYDYTSSFRMPDGSRYRISGAPLDNNNSHISIACNIDGNGDGGTAGPETRPLTERETKTLATRINAGVAALTKLPPIYEKPLGYVLSDNKIFLAFHDDSNWPYGKERAFIGSVPNNGKVEAWQELDKVTYSDGGRRGIHGFKSDQGTLSLGNSFLPQVTWNETPVKRSLSDQEAADYAKQLRETPAGTPIRPVPFANPCNGLGNGFTS